MKPIIKVENLSKQYRLGTIGTGTIKNDFKRWWHTIRGKEDPFLKIGEINDRTIKGKSDYAWALKDINFEVMPGEVLGVIGKNGAGKSTLLKILSKVTGPTTGRIDYNGRIGSLLEVGTGFHPELTGKENIFLNGAILGMSRHEIRSRLDEIIDFSGCERYIDTPVKRYSSGMTVRLGFAVAAHLEPEILVVDEVLAVGDADFQSKAIGKMQDVSQKDGRTVLFVSHNLASIKMLCNKGVLLENGTLKSAGDINTIINQYTSIKNIGFTNKLVDSIKYKNNQIRIDSILINESEYCYVNVSNSNNIIKLRVSGQIDADFKISFEARLFDYNGILLGVFSPGHFPGTSKVFKEGYFSLTESLVLPHNLTKGQYKLEVYLVQPNIEYLIEFTNPIQITSEGIPTNSGQIFDYNQCGMLML